MTPGFLNKPLTVSENITNADLVFASCLCVYHKELSIEFGVM